MVFAQGPKLVTVFMVMKVSAAIFRLATHLACMERQFNLILVNAIQDGQVGFVMYLYAIILAEFMHIALTHKSVNATKAGSQVQLLQCVIRWTCTCTTRTVSQV